MKGIPASLSQSLRTTLMECDEFISSRGLAALFRDERLRPWQGSLPEADSLISRVDLTVAYLAEKRRSSGENALVLLLQVLREKYDAEDARHQQLGRLAEQLTVSGGGATVPSSLPVGTTGGVTVIGNGNVVGNGNQVNVQTGGNFGTPGFDSGTFRALLGRLDDVELDTLCMDNFPGVYDSFSRGMRRDAKINLLLDHCRRKPEEQGRLMTLLRR